MTLFAGGDPNLFECRFDGPLKETHLGQAHIAGTGPAGTTCRHCSHFGLKDRYGEIACPGYYSKSDKLRANSLKTGKCYAQMTGKANRQFPQSAKSCLLFDQAPEPFPVAIIRP